MLMSLNFRCVGYLLGSLLLCGINGCLFFFSWLIVMNPYLCSEAYWHWWIVVHLYESILAFLMTVCFVEIQCLCIDPVEWFLWIDPIQVECCSLLSCMSHFVCFVWMQVTVPNVAETEVTLVLDVHKRNLGLIWCASHHCHLWHPI